MSGIDSYSSMLDDVCVKIDGPKVESLAKHLDISRDNRLKISTGKDLIQEMKKSGFLSEDNIDNLLDLLIGKKLEDAAERVKEYKQSLNGEDLSEKVATGEQKGTTSARVEVDLFLELSQNLAKEWKKVGRYLKLTEAELQGIEVDNRYQEEFVMQMLSKWWVKNGRGATYKILADALDKAGRRDLMEETLQYAKSPTDC